MIARRAVWSDARVQRLLTRYVPAADEVGFLQRVKSPEGELFRKVAEQGHYAGRSQPTSTRQGLYATTADGHVLGALNHNDPARVADMLERAWAAWEALPETARVPRPEPAAAADEPFRAVDPVLRERQRLEQRYPEGGLVLRVTSRDLPRPAPSQGSEPAPAANRGARDWRREAWNFDHAWFRANEAAQMVPESHVVGATRIWPEALTDRVLRVHLVDDVRGQTYPVKPAEVARARLEATITAVEGGHLVLRLRGEVRWVARGTWNIGGLSGTPGPQERGLDASLLGTARFDVAAGRFSTFEAVATGLRWGATQYNGRHDDLGPAPIGYVLERIGDRPEERVAPANIWEYRGY